MYFGISMGMGSRSTTMVVRSIMEVLDLEDSAGGCNAAVTVSVVLLPGVPKLYDNCFLAYDS